MVQSQPAKAEREGEGEADMIVDCKECRFRKTVSTEGDKLPAEFLIEHGQSTGHSLGLERPGEE